jgi:hypothetical protein
MTTPQTKPLSELLQPIRKLSARLMSHRPAHSLWFNAAKIMRDSANILVSEDLFEDGRWFLVGTWKEHERMRASALRQLSMAKRIAIRVRASMLDNEDAHFRDLEHLENAIAAIDELQRHPRFAGISHEPVPPAGGPLHS